MKLSAKKHLKKFFRNTGILIFVLIIITSSQADFVSHHHKYTNDVAPNEDIIHALSDSKSPLQDSSLNSGSVNVSIKQTYSNETDININQETTSFTTSAPMDKDYLSSTINISVKDISIHNYTDILEDSGRYWRKLVDENKPLVTSFTVPIDCYLTNASFDMRLSGTADDLRVRIYNSTWDSDNSISKPSGFNDYVYLGNITVDSSGWKDLTNINHYLNNSNTDNNTWFIGLFDLNTATFDGLWYYNADDNNGDNEDETLSYEWTVSGWSLVMDGDTVDFQTKVGLSLNTTTPDPTDINLQINGTIVDDTTSNKGEWIDTNPYSGSNGKLNFTFSADWYDFSLKVDEVTIDFTKNTFDERVEYSVDLNQLVYWNGSVNISEFESQFSDNEINFTIPYDWSISDLLNESTSITYATTSSASTKTVHVTGSSATNGKWKLKASSQNYGSSISSYVDSNPISVANFSNDVTFRALFDGEISGDVNISVYDPSQNMKYTYVNSSVEKKQTVFFPAYDLSDNVSEYGIYSIRSKWMNSTHIGYWEQNFTVLADTALNLISPSLDAIFNPTDSFTIILYLEDIGIFTPMDGATIYYDIDGTGQLSISTNNGTSGYYEIPVDCNTIIGNGDKTVEITSNKTFVNNQTLDFTFHINSPPEILSPTTIEEDSRWIQDEDFGFFDFDFTAFENDIEDSGTDLDWYIEDLDSNLVTVSGEYSDTDILRFTSVLNAYGTDTFTLWLVDSGGLTDSVSITITINPVND
ncbi:MAG: hypothetical protein JW776_11490, partial [Candidatus Lokiarchaeota archaeon]|nr:hypothetical protein [Candidatus Lokiarchaeota archaeon]